MWGCRVSSDLITSSYPFLLFWELLSLNHNNLNSTLQLIVYAKVHVIMYLTALKAT